MAGKKTEAADTGVMIEFLRDSLRHIELRIGRVDNKASILIAVLGALLAIGAVLLGQTAIFTRADVSTPFLIPYLVGVMVLGSLTMVLLVQTIRPTRWFLGLKTRGREEEVTEPDSYVMWYSHGSPLSAEEHRAVIDNMTEKGILANYQWAHFTTLRLAKIKYSVYQWAALSLKSLIVWTVVGASILFALSV